MSTAKVDKYKKEKYNRKKILARQKRHKIEAIIACVAVIAALGGVIGKNVYDKYFYYDSVKAVDMESYSTAVQNVQSANVQTAEDATEAEADA